MKERQALADVTGPRYRKAGRKDKKKILDEFCHNTGYHRKYAIAVLRNAGKTQLRRIGKETLRVKITAKTCGKRVYRRVYDEEVERVLIPIWVFFLRVCGRRLVPMIRENLPALTGKYRLSPVIHAKLARVSSSTVERMLMRERKARAPKGTCSTTPGTLLKQQIPVRTFRRWDDKQPGFCEIDTVSHDGGYAAGEYAFTLSATDVALCWPEFRALRNNARKWTVEAMEDIRASFPVPLRGIDSDNGAEFINWHLKNWCEKHRVTFTRGRQYRKNDNAYVEQKNGDIVRKTVGYVRFQGDSALDALSAVYDVLNPLMNIFYPNMKCVGKLQAGQKKKRIYEKELKTPFRRVMERPDIPEDIKRALQEKKDSLNIIALQEALNTALDNLDRLAHHAPGG
jgi:hypothetical protein